MNNFWLQKMLNPFKYILVSFYVSLIVLSSWRSEVRPKHFDGIVHLAQEILFKRLKVSATEALFYTTATQPVTKIPSEYCLQVIGKLDGHKDYAFKYSNPHCPSNRGSIRMFTDFFHQTLYRYWREFSYLSSDYRKGKQENRMRTKNFQTLIPLRKAAIADYFCRQYLRNHNQELSEVIVWFQKESYDRKLAKYKYSNEHYFKWDCQKLHFLGNQST